MDDFLRKLRTVGSIERTQSNNMTGFYGQQYTYMHVMQQLIMTHRAP